MITVLHLVTGLDVGGAEMMLLKLVTASDRARFRHLVVSLTDIGPIGQQLQAQGIPVRALGIDRARPRSFIRALIRLRGLLRRASPTVLQTWLYHADLLGLFGGMVQRVPVVWNIRATYHSGLESPTSRLCARLSGLPVAVIANSEAGRKTHERFGYHPRRWLILPNGFDLVRFAPDPGARVDVRRELGLPPKSLLIGIVARFDPLKDYPNFLRAASLLAQRNPSVHFVALGRGVTDENPALRARMEEGQLVGRIHLLGERHDIPRLTAAFDIATLSSSSEGFPGVVGEAMSCGVPCVVTAVGAAAEIVADTGRVVPAQDPAALAAGWQELVDLGPAGRATLGARARERIARHFSMERVVQQYEDLYAALAGNAR